MKIKLVLLLLILLTAISGGIYFYFLKQSTDIAPEQILGAITEKLPNNIQAPNLDNAQEITSDQLQILTQKSQEIKNHIGSVISKNQEASNSSNLGQQTFEYGKYLYCKEVVKEYEGQ